MAVLNDHDDIPWSFIIHTKDFFDDLFNCQRPGDFDGLTVA